MKNLWKGLDALEIKANNPVDLVREQADFLSEGTDDILMLEVAEVNRIGTKTREVLQEIGIEAQFTYRVALASTYLRDYAYNIFTFFYDITFYPMLVSVPKEIGTEVEKITDKLEPVDETVSRMYFKVSEEEAFETFMADVFNSENARMIMTNLKAIVSNTVSMEE